MDKGISHQCLEHHISQGLGHVRAILDGSLQLSKGDTDRRLFAKHNDFIEDSLSEAISRQYRNGKQYTIEEIMKQYSRTSDPDSGPIDAWDWARRSFAYSRCDILRHPVPFRSWGWVMWDRERLDDWCVFDLVWKTEDVDEVIKATEKQVLMDKELIITTLMEFRRAKELSDGPDSDRTLFENLRDFVMLSFPFVSVNPFLHLRGELEDNGYSVCWYCLLLILCAL